MQKCGQLLSNLVIEHKLYPEEVFILRQISQTRTDRHPDAVGLRLRIALLCIASNNVPPFEYKEDYARYLVNWKQVSAPFRISAAEEMTLGPPDDRLLWLEAVIKNLPSITITRLRGPLTPFELKVCIDNFIREAADDFKK